LPKTGGDGGVMVWPYVLTGGLILAVEAARRPRYRLDFLFFFHVYFGLAYIATPLYVLHAPDLLAQFSRADQAYTADPRVPWLIAFAYAAFLSGWAAGGLGSVPPFGAQPGRRAVRRLVVAGLVLGIVGVVGYVYAFGGLWAAFSQGALYRYDPSMHQVRSLAVTEVFKFFIYAAVLVLYLSFAKVYLLREETRFYRRALLLALVTVAVYLPIVSSRGAIVGLFLGLFTLYSLHHRVVVSARLLALVPIGILVIMYGKQFFSALPALLALDLELFQADFEAVSAARIGEGNWFVNTLFRESLHCLTSLDVAVRHVGRDIPSLGFRDVYLMPFALVPTALLGLTIELPPTVSAVNTYAHGGELIASTPPGLLGAFWYNAGAVGLVAGMAAYGWIGRIGQRKILASAPLGAGGLLFLAVLGLSFGGFVVNGDVKVYVFSLFPLVLLIAWLVGRSALVRLLRALPSLPLDADVRRPSRDRAT
jgi:MFS family permease